MTKQFQVVYNAGRKRMEFFDRAAAEHFAAEVGSVVEPVRKAHGFVLRPIERRDGKPVQKGR